ncbi:energy-coupling factor transporter ATPase [[Mycoplasma] testudinis]|uniref:energy-coupling factor transporter ATPase n=1 Tax=[Mycoplasma] testudinis TaxID=33924 RepID=UPI00055B83A9|nr:energy-coupling factor transporter ATPase [[Mycoplasma] testudinis]
MSEHINKPVAIRFDDVCFGYDEALVVKNVSFEIYQQEYVCVIGHNGSGKSTISKLLTGLLKPRSGTIYLYGHPVTKDNLKFLRDNVGIVFQNPDNQFIGITAEDDIAFGLENRKFPRNEMREIVHSVAKQVGIENILKFEPHKLSGGQKQRVAIGSILAINPNVILFDESTSMLDPKGKLDIKRFMVTLKNTGKSVISITHDMEEVINADRVLVMNHGNLVRSGTPSEIFEDEAFLREIRLDIPFTLALGKALAEKHPAIRPTLDLQKLIKSILSC